MAIYNQFRNEPIYSGLKSQGLTLTPPGLLGLNMQPEMPGGIRDVGSDQPNVRQPSIFESGATAQYAGAGGTGNVPDDSGAGEPGIPRSSSDGGGGMPSEYWTPEQKAGPKQEIVLAKSQQPSQQKEAYAEGNPVARMWAEARTGGPQAATRSYIEALSRAKDSDEAKLIQDGYLKLREVMSGGRSGGQSRLVRGGRQPQSWVTERDLGPTENTIMQLENAQDVADASKISLAELETNRSNHLAGLEQIRAVAAEKEVKAQQAEQLKTEQQFNEMRSKHEQLISEAQDMKVDPQRWWKDRSTGEKIAAGLLVVLTAGKGLDVLMKARDDDINAQMAMMQHAKDITDIRQTQMGKLWEMYKDNDLAKAALREAQTAAIQAKIESMRKQVPSGILQERLKVMSDEAEAERLRTRAGFEAALMGKQRATEAMVPDRIVSVGGRVGQWGASKAEAELAAMAFGPGGGSLTPEQRTEARERQLMVDGKPAYVANKEQIRDYANAFQRLNKNKAALDRLEALLAEKKDVPAAGADRRNWRSRYDKAVEAYNDSLRQDIMQSGVLNVNEMPLVRERDFSEWAGWNFYSADEAIDQVRAAKSTADAHMNVLKQQVYRDPEATTPIVVQKPDVVLE